MSILLLHCWAKCRQPAQAFCAPCRQVTGCQESLEATLRLAQCAAVTLQEAPQALLDRCQQLADSFCNDDACVAEPGSPCS